MSQLQQQLAAGAFVVTAEIAPPKGCDVAEALAKAQQLAEVTAINVTDNQGANMRLCPLALASLLVREGFEPILQLTCRDRNRMALQSDLLGAAALGIENLLLLSGDHARFGDHPQARPVFDLDSVQLLQVADGLTRGHDMAGKPLHRDAGLLRRGGGDPGGRALRADVPEIPQEGGERRPLFPDPGGLRHREAGRNSWPRRGRWGCRCCSACCC